MEFPFKLIWTHFEMEWKMENMERNWQFCLFSLSLSFVEWNEICWQNNGTMADGKTEQ